MNGGGSRSENSQLLIKYKQTNNCQYFYLFFASNLISRIMREYDKPVGINHYCNMFSIQWVLSHLAHGYYLY